MMKDMLIGAAIMCGLSMFTVYAVVPLVAQQSTPNSINGCIFISGGITLTNLQSTPFMCVQNGHLKVNTTAGG